MFLARSYCYLLRTPYIEETCTGKKLLITKGTDVIFWQSCIYQTYHFPEKLLEISHFLRVSEHHPYLNPMEIHVSHVWFDHVSSPTFVVLRGVGSTSPQTIGRHGKKTKRPETASIESWLFNKDPYNGSL